jgi:serine/threonine protein phosphatase PrpC
LTRVPPEERSSAATWGYSSNTIQVAAVWTEKKKGRGEDGPPTSLHHTSGRGLLAVYDGAGGAGSHPIGLTPDGQEVTGAFLAPRLVHFAFEEWFYATVRGQHTPDSAEVAQTIQTCLREAEVPSNNKISGTLVRHLPTTLASVEYERADQALELRSRWAGDSRAYLLTGKCGLQALTRDDTETSDALAVLNNDQPMSNMISADRPFRINEFRAQVNPPVVLICATDGFFNYLRTPAHFEYLLLSKLHAASDPGDWAERLAERVQHYSGDDASLVITSYGYRTFEALRAAFEKRLAWIASRFIKPVDETMGQHPEQYQASRQASWNEYKTDYEYWIRQMETQMETAR